MREIDEQYYTVVKRVINSETAAVAATQLEILRNLKAAQEDKPLQNYVSGDELVKENNFSWYAPHFGEAILKETTDLASQISGKVLIPAYSYVRMYYRGSSMVGHIDRPSCEYSMTIPLRFKGDPWDINIRNAAGEEKKIPLDIGEAMFYQGSKIWHWRDEYVEGYEQCQLFLHWVDVAGEWAHYALDKRPCLGAPAVEAVLKSKQTGEY